MDGMSICRRGGMVAAAVLAGVVLMVGGCNKANKQAELAQQESKELREKNVELDTRLREKDVKIAELEGRLAQTQGAQPTDLRNNWNEPRSNPPRTYNPGSNTGSNETFVVSGDVLFPSGQATLKPEAKKELDRIATTIKTKHAGATIRVEGYTDTDPIKKSKWGSNEALSQARAEAVEKYLASKGISAGRISAVGMGAANPKSTKAASRRVEIIVTH